MNSGSFVLMGEWYDEDNNKYVQKAVAVNESGAVLHTTEEAQSLTELSDATITSPEAGQVLVYDGDEEEFVNDFLDISNLAGTAIAAPADGEFLVHNGTNFENRALETGDIPAATQALINAAMPLVLVGRTASSTQTQGQGAITLTSANEMIIFVQVATCAVAGNAQTLPAAVANRVVQFTNNGAQACGVFPALGDNAGAGVDTVVSVAAGATKWFLASDSTNWKVV